MRKVRKVIYVVPPKDLHQKGKIWRLLKSLYEISKNAGGKNSIIMVSEKFCQCLYWGAILEALGVHWGDDFIFGIPDDRADNLEQLMREKVKICEPSAWFSNDICGIPAQEDGLELKVTHDL